MEDLFSRRLIIQSGKGGTGKTTISAALAVAAASRGKRVLLVEVDTRDRFAPLFGLKEPVGYEVREVRDGVFALNLDPELVIIDFFKTHVKLKTIYKQVLESKIFKYFYEAAPGVKEIICMGKVWRLLGERHFFSGKPQWDCVILDAPATGHGISLLNIAQAAYETLFGPMKKHAEKIRDMLRDPKLTVLNIVAIPEEMPVNEAADLYQLAKGELRMPLGVAFLNAMMPPLFTPEESAALDREGRAGDRLERILGGPRAVGALLACARSRDERAQMARRYETRLRELIPLPVVPVPYVFDADFDLGTLEAVAKEVAAALAPAAAPHKRAAGREGSRDS
ncbi:MAG TPA: ArsA-related P-loop ATPase [Planctomycetota bacterium]|nr:ArsA-related P-loop ATPase [Planctomycetota bacterium]